MIILDEKSGFWRREDSSSDKYIIHETKGEYKFLCDELDGMTVLDMGGYIGTFSRFCIENGAVKVISIEPNPYNFELLSKNNIHKQEILQRAVDKDRKRLKLYIPENNFAGSTTRFRAKHGNYELVNVKTIKFDFLLSKYKPQIIKSDIEGVEYDIFDKDLPLYVTHIAIEFHLRFGEWRDKMIAMCKSFNRQGFKTLKPPNFEVKYPLTTGYFKR